MPVLQTSARTIGIKSAMGLRGGTISCILAVFLLVWTRSVAEGTSLVSGDDGELHQEQ